MPVVDALETVEIDDQDRPSLARLADRHCQPLGKQPAVRQVRQAVVHRQMGDPRLSQLALGDVGIGANEAAGSQRMGAYLQDAAVVALLLAGKAAVDIAFQQLPSQPPGRRIARQVQQFAGPAVDNRHPAALVHHDNALADRIDRVTQHLARDQQPARVGQQQRPRDQDQHRDAAGEQQILLRVEPIGRHDFARSRPTTT